MLYCISPKHDTNISHMCHPFSHAIQKHEVKVEALPRTTLRKKPFSSTSGMQRSFQWLEILSHLTGLNETQFPDTLERMGNHSPPGSHLHPVLTLTRQTDYLGFFLKSTFCLMKTLLVLSRFKWWHSFFFLLEELQNGLGRLPSWFKGNWKTAFSKR